jgi:hypothetical protein
MISHVLKYLKRNGSNAIGPSPQASGFRSKNSAVTFKWSALPSRLTEGKTSKLRGNCTSRLLEQSVTLLY